MKSPRTVSARWGTGTMGQTAAIPSMDLLTKSRDPTTGRYMNSRSPVRIWWLRNPS